MLIDPMREALLKVAPGATLVRLSTPPVMGAVMLGMEQCALRRRRCASGLIETTQGLLAVKAAA